MLPQSERSGYGSSFVENSHKQGITNDWGTRNGPAVWHRPTHQMFEKVPEVSSPTMRQTHGDAGRFRQSDPEKRLEEMLGLSTSLQMPLPVSGHDDSNSIPTLQQWRPAERDVSIKRFGFHNDMRVNSSDSGLFTAFENDEEMVPERIIDHHDCRQNVKNELNSSRQYKNKTPDSCTGTYINQNVKTKSQNFQNQSQFKSKKESISTYEAIFLPCKRLPTTSRSTALSQATSVQTHTTVPPLEVKGGAQAKTTMRAMQARNQNPHQSVKETNLHSQFSRDHKYGGSNQQNIQPFCSVRRIGTDLPKQSQHEQAEQCVSEQLQRQERAAGWSKRHSQTLVGSEFHHKNCTTPIKKDTDHEEPEDFHPTQQRFKENQQHIQCNTVQRYVSQRSQAEPDNFYPTSSNTVPSARSISKEQGRMSLNSEHDVQVVTRLLRKPELHAPLKGRSSSRNLSSSSEKDSIENNLAKPINQNFSMEENTCSNPVRFEQYVDRDQVPSTNIGVRRRTKRVNSKAKKSSADSPTHLPPEQYCFEDFQSSDSDTDSLNQSQRSHMTWVRGGAGRYSDRGLFGGHQSLSNSASNFTRSFLIGNHLFGGGHSLSARAFGHRDFKTESNTSNGLSKCAEQTVQKSKILKREYYEPLTESDSAQSGLAFDVVPGLVPENSIVVTRKETRTNWKRDISNTSTEENISHSISVSIGSQSCDYKNEAQDNIIYENCTSPEASKSFNFTSPNAQETKNQSDYEDDSTIYESIHPQSLHGDNEEVDSDSESNIDMPVTSVGLSTRYQTSQNKGSSDEDGYQSEENITSSKKELLRAKTMPAISVSSVLTAEELRQHGVASTGSSGTTKSGDLSSRSGGGGSSKQSCGSKHSSNSNGSGSSSSSNTGPGVVGAIKSRVYRRSSATSSGSSSPFGASSPRRRPQQQSVPAGIARKMSYTEAYLGCMKTAGSAEPSPTTSERKLEKNKRFFNLRSMSENRLGKGKAKNTDPNVNKGSAWSFEEERRSIGCSQNASLEEVRPTAQLFYTTPPKANMVRSCSNDKKLETSSSSGNLQKLSRRLVLRDKKEPLSPSRSRSISLDWGDARSVRLTHGGIEDMESSTDVLTGLPASPSAPAHLSNKDLFRDSVHERTNNSPRLMRDIRLLANSQKKKSMSMDIPDSQLPGKRKADKEKRYLQDSAALFEAVEQQQLDVVKGILGCSTVDINSLNGEDLSVLDIAVMTNNIPMAKMLLSRGAKESPIFQRGECRLQRLELLVGEAERRVIDLTATVLNGSSGNANISPAQQKENERQLAYWEFRHKLLKRMKAGYEHARPPESPTNVRLDVASNSSLLVTFAEPRSHNGAVVTRYKVEWSSYENFLPLSGEAIVEDLSNLEFEIKSLTRGSHYFVRVCAWNVKGYGPYCSSEPLSAAPSSWREVDGIQSRQEGKVASLYTLYHQVKRSRPPETSEMKDIFKRNGESPLQKKKISIKNLFVSAPKFQKSIKRGVYMACLLYNEDKLLVTSEEQLPIIEVDETFSGPNIQNDLYWLLKVSCMWEEIKVLKLDMEKTNSAGSTFRCKLLQAIISLQNGLGIQDLGQFFHRPVRDNNSSIIFTVVNQIRDPKVVTLSSGKWVTFGKLARRQSLSTIDAADAHNLLISCVPEMMLYHQVSGQRLARGLYLGYVKLQASVEVLRVMVPNRTPSCVPHVKIRDCPNVSREEWAWLLKSDSYKIGQNLSDSQSEFKSQLSAAARKLFNLLDLSEDTVSSHRIYDLEVLELSPTVTMVLVMPSIEEICIGPGHTDNLAKRVDYSFLPVQIFESIHMKTYLPEFFSLFARLSAIVEMDGVLAQQGHREAFSTEELYRAKEQVEVTAHLQQNLDRIWKCARWIRDVTTYARNREKKAGIHLAHILSGSGGTRFSEGNRREDAGGGVQNNNGEGVDAGGNIVLRSNISPSRPSQGSTVQLGNNNHSNHDFINNSGGQNKNNNNSSSSNQNNMSFGASHRHSTSSLSSNNSSSSLCSQGAYRLSMGGRGGRGSDVRLMAKFFGPNEANPHSSDSISICRGHTRSADVSPTTQPSHPSSAKNITFTNTSSSSGKFSSGNFSLSQESNQSLEANPRFAKSSSFSSTPTTNNAVDSLTRPSRVELVLSHSSSAPIPRITPSPSLSSISTAVSSTSSSSSSYTNHPAVTVDHVTPDSEEKTMLNGANSSINTTTNPLPKTIVRRSYSAETDTSSQSFSTSSSPPQHPHACHKQDLEAEDNAIVKVHAMYETGLKRNVNIKLHISEQTTSRDIVNLVVKHLNSVVQRKGKGAFVYPDDTLQNFCLVLIFHDGTKKVLANEDTPLSLGDELHKARVCVTILESILSRRLASGAKAVCSNADDDDDDGLGQATIV